MNVIEKFSADHIRDLHTLYQQEWWTKARSLDETQRCVQGSQLAIGITDEQEKLIGFVRVLTDFTFKALIFDVIVSDDYRGQQLGLKLMSLVVEHPKLQAVKHFELYCLPEMFAFYEKLGFSEQQVGDVRLMRLATA